MAAQIGRYVNRRVSPVGAAVVTPFGIPAVKDTVSHNCDLLETKLPRKRGGSGSRGKQNSDFGSGGSA
jgi:hypothetical protein